MLLLVLRCAAHPLIIEEGLDCFVIIIQELIDAEGE